MTNKSSTNDVERDSHRLKLAGSFARESDHDVKAAENAIKALIQNADFQNISKTNQPKKSSMKRGSAKESVKKKRHAEIKQRIDDGFYDDPYQMAELAERLIKKFGLD